MPQVLKTGCK